MFRLHQIALFAAMSGGAYAHGYNQPLGPLSTIMLTPAQVALGHAYNGGGGRRGKHQRPRLKSCRIKVSRRVRRKHRRAR